MAGRPAGNHGAAGQLVLGVGARRDTGSAIVRAAVDEVLASAGLGAAAVGILATLDRRAGDPGVQRLVLDFGWRLVALSSSELAAQEVPNPSRAVASGVGTPSVAEAAALLAAGPGSVLIVPKTVFPSVTVAIAEVRSRSGRTIPGTR
ncbi:cobalamin biosynthesis protein [Paractinoplanes atraurantiacus]|uniref:Cobalt-precorrin 5A hydrolase n=1 Tax=Paractinoplanes atraurantiacus TaxID=1036182 RepID=A0A285J4V5_9ACTN|nr:cobalamin biosynthesis protein [Actinoplanes atraurantiacus]SNY55242.1 cobalt-precorrin 5A hydrolase [Actinoplanes atraurantiacus]